MAMEARMLSCLLLFMGLLWLCGSFGGLITSTAQSNFTNMTLHKDEIPVLKAIARKLQVEFWNFSVDPCSGVEPWISPANNKKFTRNVTCGNCNNKTNICHVTSIELKVQNLRGVLPEEFANLTFLTNIDLTRNYINGTIPASWASLPLVSISLLVNRISGKIPDEIGEITSLKNIDFEDNLLEGPLPPTLSKLTNLTDLHLSANNLSGELPPILGNLKSLEDFRIDGNAISGRIPIFIGNWTNLTRLDMQGTSLEGPFPPVFSAFPKLKELRVTDISGEGTFPQLQKNPKLIYLILRNCSITGKIPSYVGKMEKLKRLDLSFNKLTGEIPDTFSELDIDYMYLTNNMLNGSIPNWVLKSRENLDLSYNSFTGPAPSSCNNGKLNLVSSFLSSESNTTNSCLRKNFPCAKKAKNYHLFINCGGKREKIGNITYEEDNLNSGASNFFLSRDQRWASSTTGHFVGEIDTPYIETNRSVLNMTNPKLYLDARLTPLSLRYYGLCLQKGNYTVKLHFAEIKFTDDQTFSSLGRRIFDVYIQDKKVLEDFNIAEQANGTGRAIIKPFFALVGTDGTLEIRFQWVGKGTNAIPFRAAYGPLISAISVTPNFVPDMGEEKLPDREEETKKLSRGAIIGIVIASSVLGLVIMILLAYCWKKKYNEEGLESLPGHYSLRQIKSATNNFDPVNKIGEGGFGPVYKGKLPDGTLIAVKQLSSKSKQGNREFLNEVGIVSSVQHPNLVKLFGCCIGGNQLLLIYEYLENNSLARALFGREGIILNLTWEIRQKISLDIARGLAYLHEESRLKIVHRDIKATNILLDRDLNAKISDFGLAKLDEEDNTHISTRVAGTAGYMAPEYAMRGHLTDKADVYSFGVVLLEIISGKSNTSYKPKEEFVYLLDWAYVLQEQGNMLELVDPVLGSNYSKQEAEQTLQLALLCTNPSPTLRPTMSTVVSMLEGHTPIQILSKDANKTEDEELKLKSFQKYSHDSQVTNSTSTDGPPTSSSNLSLHVAN